MDSRSSRVKKKKRGGGGGREERSSGNIPAVMFARTDRLFQHLCLRIDGCPPGIKKNVRTKVEKFEPPPRNLSLYLLSNDDGLTTILGRREEGGEIALATLRELCIFDESESLSLSLLLLLMLAARVFESIVINY